MAPPAGYPTGAGYGPPPAAQATPPNQNAIAISLLAVVCGWAAIIYGLPTGGNSLGQMSGFEHAIWLSVLAIWNGFRGRHRPLAATLCILLGVINLLGALTFALELSAQMSRR